MTEHEYTQTTFKHMTATTLHQHLQKQSHKSQDLVLKENQQCTEKSSTQMLDYIFQFNRTDSFVLNAGLFEITHTDDRAEQQRTCVIVKPIHFYIQC